MGRHLLLPAADNLSVLNFASSNHEPHANLINAVHADSARVTTGLRCRSLMVSGTPKDYITGLQSAVEVPYF